MSATVAVVELLAINTSDMQDNIKNINIHKLAENTVNISQDTF
jgi:hypothetical protein